MINSADVRARFAASWDSAAEAPPVIVRHLDSPCPPGFAVYGIAGSPGRTVLPAVLLGSPPSLVQRYALRVLAALTGRCPACSAVAWLDTDADPERTPAGWAAAEVRVGLHHATDCPATFTEADRPHFDPRALGDPPPRPQPQPQPPSDSDPA